MELSEKILLSDVKLGFQQMKNASEDFFSLLMHSFANNGPDYEKESFAKTVYNILDWNENHFDVVNSFWIPFSYVMQCVYPKEYEIAPAGNIKIYKNHYCDPNGKYEIESFPEKYIDKNRNEIINNQVLKLPFICEINNFASLCHCIANFMPCPDNQFNSAKGLGEDVKDYLPLMINKV